MTHRQFKVLILVDAAVLVAAMIATFVSEYSSAVGAVETDNLESDSPLLLGLLAAISLLGVASMIAMYFFKSWGRTTALYTTLAALPLAIFVGPSVFDPVESVLYDTSNMLWGAILCAAYFTPVKERFDG